MLEKTHTIHIFQTDFGVHIESYLLLLLRGYIAQDLPSTATISQLLCVLHLSSNNSWFIHKSSLAVIRSHLVAKQGGTWQEITVNFADEVCLSYSAGFFNMA
jgi:hypothetical protein